MQDVDVRNVMILIAILTPLIGLLLFWVGRWAAKAGERPLPPSVARNAWLLIFAGPVNLLVWWLFNGVLSGMGSRNVVGMALAAVVFIGMGFFTGFFSRLARRGENRQRKDPEE